MSSLRRNPATQAEIARITGVSQATVSAILGSSETSKVVVGEETRKRVLEVAARRGYRLRKRSVKVRPAGRMRTVLLVNSEPGISTDAPWMAAAMEALFERMTRACVEGLAEANVRLMLLNGNAATVVHWLRESDVDGVLWHGPDTDPAPLQWIASRYPLVLLNRVWTGSADCDIVSLNQEQAQVLAMEHVWERGHRRIAMFGHWKDNSFFRRRVAAYRQFVGEKGLREYREFLEIDDNPRIPAVDKVESLLRLWRDLGDEAPTALIAPDVFTVPLARRAAHYRIRVPGDLSLVALDNSLPCQTVSPMVTAVDSHFGELGRTAVDVLIQRMDNPGVLPRTIQISPRIILRDTVRDLRATGVPRGAAFPSSH